MNIPGPGLVWPSVSASSSAITVESGSSRSPEKDPTFSSPSPSDSAEASKRRYILIVEDNKADLFLIRESIEAAHLDAELHVVHDGEKAIKFFESVDADPSIRCPELILLDINLPKRQGREVLQQLRESQRCANMLVLVVTSSNSERDRSEMGQLGITEYFRKPTDYDEFMRLGEVVRKLLGGRASSQGSSS